MTKDGSFKYRKEKWGRRKRRKEGGREGRKERKKLFQLVYKELYSSNTEPYFL